MPGVTEAGGVEGVEGGVDALRAAVHGVVGGQRAPVEARGLDAPDDLGRHAVDRVGRQRLAGRGDGRLEVADAEVGRGDHGLHVGEHRGEVVRRARARGVVLGHVDDRRVQQDVAGRGQRERPQRRSRGGRGGGGRTWRRGHALRQDGACRLPGHGGRLGRRGQRLEHDVGPRGATSCGHEGKKKERAPPLHERDRTAPRRAGGGWSPPAGPPRPMGGFGAPERREPAHRSRPGRRTGQRSSAPGSPGQRRATS